MRKKGSGKVLAWFKNFEDKILANKETREVNNTVNIPKPNLHTITIELQYITSDKREKD